MTEDRGLVSLRATLGLTRHQLADLSGYSASLVTKIERGERAEPADMRRRLVVALRRRAARAAAWL